ncbi:MAG TPA: dihydropteroate synthase [bacterium]|nr:dihydropteroate synthase [bacterium]
MEPPGIFGIVNVTRDSFSDGGRYLSPDQALAHADGLRADGADVLDLGAESTHPDSEDVAADEEIRRLEPVVAALVGDGASVSVDTTKAEVMRAMLALGVDWLNDVNGFRDQDALAAAAAAPPQVRFVVMFSRSRGPRADRGAAGAGDLFAELREFFDERRRAFAAVGVGADRLVFDPGMGFFLGRDASPSLFVLRQLDQLTRDYGELLVSVSRKSFLGEVTDSPVGQRGPATLAAELWAARRGARWIRTHDVRALRDACRVEAAIAAAGREQGAVS